MRYIRFLKTPRIVDKNPAKPHVYCLVTVTSDLGDSFLPYDAVLSAELWSEDPEEVIVWSTLQWTSGMRSLPITLPLSKSRATKTLRIRVGAGESKSKFDAYSSLYEDSRRGVVSAWSAPLSPALGLKEAVKLVERRFIYGNGQEVNIWEETGESIARHLWDAGVTISCHMEYQLALGNRKAILSQALPNCAEGTRFQMLELGTGCGMVGISVAQMIEQANIILTDLPEAEDIVQRNITRARVANGTTLNFQELDWETNIPKDLNNWSKCPHCTQFDLILAADCTYNPDSSPALVSTMRRLAMASPKALIAIAMKKRHSAEDIFFDLMADAGFGTAEDEIEYPLPGDEENGDEIVYVYLYKYAGKDIIEVSRNEFCHVNGE